MFHHSQKNTYKRSLCLPSKFVEEYIFPSCLLLKLGGVRAVVITNRSHNILSISNSVLVISFWCHECCSRHFFIFLGSGLQPYVYQKWSLLMLLSSIAEVASWLWHFSEDQYDCQLEIQVFDGTEFRHVVHILATNQMHWRRYPPM